MDEIIGLLRSLWPEQKPPITPEQLLRTILADGANPVDSEVILQHETCDGIRNSRIAELLGAYDVWADIQAHADNYNYYEAKLNVEALLAYCQVIKNRRVISTLNWRLGIAPNSVDIDDIVCILHGSPTPVVLRMLSDGTYVVIGQAYVEGIMRGGAVTWAESEADVFILS
jgi:hypothetical protein